MSKRDELLKRIRAGWKDASPGKGRVLTSEDWPTNRGDKWIGVPFGEVVDIPWRALGQDREGTGKGQLGGIGEVQSIQWDTNQKDPEETRLTIIFKDVQPNRHRPLQERIELAHSLWMNER